MRSRPFRGRGARAAARVEGPPETVTVDGEALSTDELVRRYLSVRDDLDALRRQSKLALKAQDNEA